MVPGAGAEQAGAMTSTPDSDPGAQPGPTPPGDTDTFEHSPPDHGVTDSGPRVGRDQLRDVTRLRRPLDRKVAGVAAGLARHLDIDPLVVRVAFVVLAFFGGSGLVLYGALWLVLPEDGRENAVVPLDEKSRAIAVIGVGILAALLLLGDSWGLYWFPWPLAIVAVAVWFLFFRERRPAPQQWTTPAPGAPAAPGVPAAPAAQQYPESQYPASQYPAPQYAAPQYDTSSQYAAPQYDTSQYAVPRPPVTRPRDPRKRGPVLFWFTLALIALAEGTLGIVDLAGTHVVDSAYPALALAITGVMLVVGAFYGRAGGLILVGLLASAFTAGALATEQYDRDHLRETPQLAEQVEGRYWMPAGELVLDLSEVSDVEQLDGRRIEVGGGVGLLEVVVPDEVDVRVEADVNGPGSITLFDREIGGIDTNAHTFRSGDDADAPEILVDVELGVGEIIVTNE